MSLVEGWKHEKVRLYSLMLFISFAILFMFTVLLYGTSLKQVTIVVDGKPKVVETSQPTLQRLLDEQDITIGKHDKLSASLSSQLTHGDQIEISRSHAIYVTIKGKTQTLQTTEKTVGNALNAASIKVDGDDKLYPAATTKVRAGMKVKVLRITKLMVESKKTDTFDTIEKKDSSLAIGKQRLVSEGQNGEILKTVRKTYADGKLVEVKLVDQKVLQVKRDKVVAVGTRKPVTLASASSSVSHKSGKLARAGKDFTYKKVLNNVTLTAYSADFASTGKSPGHKYYGITASGARVQEGKTIAVDPRVIPIGYWVYIEGVGYRRAEDKGSAIRGNKIDVYVPTHREAIQFGRQRGRTVYVIGPTRP
jgi:uncharacterized protein YabE (DUF348 family)/3D (Asp-Asp-Asp) domain-containing protein